MLFYHVVSIMKSPFLFTTCGLCNAQHAVLSADSLPLVQHMLYIETTTNLGETSACVILHVRWYFFMCHAWSQQAAADRRPSSSRCLTYEAKDPTKNINHAEAYLFVRPNSFPFLRSCLIYSVCSPRRQNHVDLQTKIWSQKNSTSSLAMWLVCLHLSDWLNLRFQLECPSNYI